MEDAVTPLIVVLLQLQCSLGIVEYICQCQQVFTVAELIDKRGQTSLLCTVKLKLRGGYPGEHRQQTCHCHQCVTWHSLASPLLSLASRFSS